MPDDRTRFKISNNHVRFYSYAFLDRHPYMNGFFRKVTLTITPEHNERMRLKYVDFDQRNPRVGGYFNAFALFMWAKGFKHYSADAIMHRVRWETDAGDPPPYGDPE